MQNLLRLYKNGIYTIPGPVWKVDADKGLLRNDLYDIPATTIIRMLHEIDANEEITVNTHTKFLVELDDFANNKYDWLPFAIALHLLITVPTAHVIFHSKRYSPVEYSNLLDCYGREMRCFQNFSIYTNVVNDDRAPRVFYITDKKGEMISLYNDIVHSRNSNCFSPYYLKHLTNPYWNGRFYTHPFDHLPVKNISPLDFLKTEPQWKKEGYEVAETSKYILAHDQMKTVTLKKYFPSTSVVKKNHSVL